MLCLSVLLILLVEKSGIRLIDGGVHGVIMATAGFLDAKKRTYTPQLWYKRPPEEITRTIGSILKVPDGAWSC